MTNLQFMLYVVPVLLTALCGVGVLAVYMMPRPQSPQQSHAATDRQRRIAAE